ALLARLCADRGQKEQVRSGEASADDSVVLSEFLDDCVVPVAHVPSLSARPELLPFGMRGKGHNSGFGRLETSDGASGGAAAKEATAEKRALERAIAVHPT